MDKLDNPGLSRLFLTHLADLYHIKEKREGIHLSTLIYCLTRSFFDQVAPIEPTDSEVMLFVLGYGLQDVLTPQGAETPLYELDGITFRPDLLLPIGDKKGLAELKTTRMSSGKEEFPETWIEYMKGGCHMRGVNVYDLSVLHMMGNWHPPFPEIKSYTLVFTEEELDDNWKYILCRKEVYTVALDTNTPPIPGEHCKEWECPRCRYKLQCSVIKMVKEKDG